MVFSPYTFSLASYAQFFTHGASEASGVRNFWHLSAKILYTVEPKTATSPCVHFEVAASPTEKNTSLLRVSIFSRFDIVEIIDSNTREIISSATFAWTTDNFQALLKGIFLGSVFNLLLANIGPGPCVTPFTFIFNICMQMRQKYCQVKSLLDAQQLQTDINQMN